MSEPMYESPHVTPRTVVVTMPDGTFADGRPKVRCVYINFLSHGERGRRDEQTEPDPFVVWTTNVDASVNGDAGASVSIRYADGHRDVLAVEP